MDPLYLRKLLINRQLKQEKISSHKIEQTNSVNVNQSTETNVAKQAESLVSQIRSEMLNPKQLKMNYLASMERSSYVKKMMNLPKTLPELLMQLQNEDSIVDDMVEMYYGQNKQKQEQRKSDIREGIIRNAKESFDEALNKENKIVRPQQIQHSQTSRHPELVSGSDSQVRPELKPEQPEVLPQVKPEQRPEQNIQRPQVEVKPNVPPQQNVQPPRHPELVSGSDSQVRPELKPEQPEVLPQVKPEQRPEQNIQRPQVEAKPNILPQQNVQPPRHPELVSGSDSQVRPELKPEQPEVLPQVKPEQRPEQNIQRPQVEAKPNILPQQNVQPPRHPELVSGSDSQVRPELKPEQSEVLPQVKPEQRPEQNIQRPQVEAKPNILPQQNVQPPRHPELVSGSDSQVRPELKPEQPEVLPQVKPEQRPEQNIQRPQVEVKPNIPPQQNVQPPQVDIPRPQTPPVNQVVQPDMPDVEPTQPQLQRPDVQPPQVEVKPNVLPQQNVQPPQVDIPRPQTPPVNQVVQPDMPDVEPTQPQLQRPDVQPPRHPELVSGSDSQVRPELKPEQPEVLPQVKPEQRPEQNIQRPQVEVKPNVLPQQNVQPPQVDIPRPQTPPVNQVVQPDMPNVESTQPQLQRPDVQPPRHPELVSGSDSQVRPELKPQQPEVLPQVKPEQRPEQNIQRPQVEVKPNVLPQQNVQPPQVEVKPNVPPQQNVQPPQVEAKPNVPPQQNVQPPQVEVKPNIPPQQNVQPPQVEAKPNVPPQQNVQPPQVEVKPNIPPQQNVQPPQVEAKPNVPPQQNVQPPQVEVKPNIPPQQNVQPPQVEVKPNVLPQQNVQPPQVDIPRPQTPPVNQVVQPDMPDVESTQPQLQRPDVQPPRHPELVSGSDSQVRPELKPQQPEVLPQVKPEQRPEQNIQRPQVDIKPEHHRPIHHKLPPPPPKKALNPETVAAMNILQNMQQPVEPTITQMRQRLSGDAAELFFTGLINLNDLSETLKNNTKSAKAKLILAMANASKQGIDNSQINDTMKMLTASMAAAESTTPSKILKNIIELYLPWYPLQQGVGFELSIETKPGEQDFLSILKVWIQTRNYGNVNAVLTLVTANSVDMNIKCSEEFPKDNLIKSLNEETFNHTMQSNISIEEVAQREDYIDPEQQAKVNLSSTYELNPYLLLMAHSFIKNTIVIDSSSTIG